MTDTLYYSNIADLAALVRARRLSPVQIVQTCLSRIDELNPRINAFALVLADEARSQAHAAEAEIREGRWRGPLHGIPVGIKDFYDTAGVRTTAAFKPFATRVPQADAVSVATLKDAGAIVVGKTNMHTLGAGTTGLESLFGPVQNPWHADYIPGGSSSGSAAAVATGMCYATLDTDAIGSCRLPASCCGVVGFKGTFGLVSTEGILAGEQTPDESIRWLAHAGITGRSVDDCAHVLSALSPTSDDPARDDSTAQRRLVVGIVDNFSADEEVTAAFLNATQRVRSFGLDVVSVNAPLEMPRFDPRQIETDRKSMVSRTFEHADLLILPTTATPPLSVAESRTTPQSLSAANTMFANYLGLPAISVPCGFNRNGLPLGLQIVGRPGDDRAVLALAHRYQSTTTFAATHPIP